MEGNSRRIPKDGWCSELVALFVAPDLFLVARRFKHLSERLIPTSTSPNNPNIGYGKRGWEEGKTSV